LLLFTFTKLFVIIYIYSIICYYSYLLNYLLLCIFIKLFIFTKLFIKLFIFIKLFTFIKLLYIKYLYNTHVFAFVKYNNKNNLISYKNIADILTIPFDFKWKSLPNDINNLPIIQILIPL
jgi:hypothetical protein